jgi:hypothetical protein
LFSHNEPPEQNTDYTIDWVEIAEEEQRCAILRLIPLTTNQVSYYVVGSSELFVTNMIMQFT